MEKARRAPQRIDLVTGAFSFTGSRVAKRLLDRGVRVRTLTHHPRRDHPLAGRVETFPYDFDHPERLRERLAGVQTLYNTYWVRFARGANDYERAVANTENLFRAARDVGVRRVVHVSIANPSTLSPLPYYAGKAALEETLRESGLSYAIVRPTVLFGRGALLINNIAWLLRRLPVFAVPGKGDYRLQPVHVEDLASLMVESGDATEDLVTDAAGPECLTYLELVELIRDRTGARSRIVHGHPRVVHALGRLVGWIARDVLITRDEVRGLMDDLLVSHSPPRCRRSFREWLESNRDEIGKSYLSELDLHFRRRGQSHPAGG